MFPRSVLILLESQARRDSWGGLFLFVFSGSYVVYFFLFFYSKFEEYNLLPFHLGNRIAEHGTLPFWLHRLVIVRYSCHLKNNSAPPQMSNEWVLDKNWAFYYMWSLGQSFSKELFREQHGHRKQIKYNWVTIWDVCKYWRELEVISGVYEHRKDMIIFVWQYKKLNYYMK